MFLVGFYQFKTFYPTYTYYIVYVGLNGFAQKQISREVKFWDTRKNKTYVPHTRPLGCILCMYNTTYIECFAIVVISMDRAKWKKCWTPS